MKFSHSIQFNAVPDWSSHYIAYSNLKKLIYQLEKTALQPAGDAESRPLIHDEEPEDVFSRALGVELEKISSFYVTKERELLDEVAELMKDVGDFLHDQQDGHHYAADRLHGHRAPGHRRSASLGDGMDDSDDEYDEDETSGLAKRRGSTSRRRTLANLLHQSVDSIADSSDRPRSLRRSSVAIDDYAEQSFLHSPSIFLKKRITDLYVQLCELKAYVQLNKTGFRKVLKKFDKIMDKDLRPKYMAAHVEPAYPFREDTLHALEENINKMIKAYTEVIAEGDEEMAKRDLRSHLREHVVWERNTVWRDMIRMERRSEAATLGRTLLGTDPGMGARILQGDDEVLASTTQFMTPLGRLVLPRWLANSAVLTLGASIAIFFVLLFVPIMDSPEQQNCLALLVFVSMLWATEAIPLFVTSLAIPFLCVILRVIRSDDEPHARRLGAKEATTYVFAAMWTPVIMLLLGGFTLAAALSKCSVDKRLATLVLSKAGTTPRTVLVANMFVAAFASMLISNVAAPVLCFSIIEPMLRTLPPDSNMAKAVIMGIALASNIGGMLSPIASPQNVVAMGIMTPAPTWIQWFFIAIPIGVISLVLIWLLLLISFRPGKGTTIAAIRPIKERFTGVQWFVTAITLITIGLWCASHQLESVFGDMGVIAIIPIVLFFGSGLLTKEDFNNFPWTIIILAAGGLSLGKAVNSSGLLHTVARIVSTHVEGMSLYGVLVVFSTLILILATFISHTVAALIILPLVYDVGRNMGEPYPNLLVMGGVLMCSAAMGLPTSGFPNMTAIMKEDPTGRRYLRVKDFISTGVLSSVVTLIVSVTIGYGIMRNGGGGNRPQNEVRTHPDSELVRSLVARELLGAMLSAFTAHPIIELKQRDKSKIETILAYGDRILVGLNTGALRVYRLNELDPPPAHANGSSATSPPKGSTAEQPPPQTTKKPTDLLREVEKFSPRAIEQLAIVKEANILVSLSNYHVSLHDRQTYQLVETLSRTKNASCFAVTSNIVKDPATGIPEIISRLAVAVRRRLLIWSWHESELSEDVAEITLAESIRTVTWASATKIVCGMNAGYVLVDVLTQDVQDIFCPGSSASGGQASRFGQASSAGIAYMGLGGYMPKPLAAKLADGEMLLAKDINTLFITEEGKPIEKKWQIPWVAAPDAIGYSYPYILALQPPSKGSLEVRNPDTLSLLQTISLPGAAQLHFPPPNVSLAHAGKGFHISSERCVWKMGATDYDSQVEELVATGRLDEAISLLSMLEDALLKNKTESLREVKMTKAEVLFKQKKFRDSMYLFNEEGVHAPPERVLKLYPPSIAGELSGWEQTQQRDSVDEERNEEDGSPAKANGESADAHTNAELPPPSPASTVRGAGGFAKLFMGGRWAHSDTSSVTPKKQEADTEETASVKDKQADGQQQPLEGKDLSDAVHALTGYLVGTRTRFQRVLDPATGKLKRTDSNGSTEEALKSLMSTHHDETDQQVEDELREAFRLVDTSLFRAYMFQLPQLAGSLFRIPNFCDPDVVNEKLLEHSRFTELVDFFYGKKLHSQALDLLRRFGAAETPDESAPTLHGPQRTVAYLQSLPPSEIDLIFQHSKWTLEADPDLGMEAFLADSENAETLPRDRVVDFLAGISAGLEVRYLEHIIGELNDATPEFHNRLVELYIKGLRGDKGDEKWEDTMGRFLSFLRRSREYSLGKAFQLLPRDDPAFYEARAVVLCNMGSHKQALEIYVFHMKDYVKAEEIHRGDGTRPSSPDGVRPTSLDDAEEGVPSIYHTLLSLYLAPPPPHERALQPALDLLSKHGSRLPAASTLSLIPDTLPVGQLESFLRGRIRSANSIVNESRILAGLRATEYIASQALLLLGDGIPGGQGGRNRRVVITEERLCGVCHKRLGGSVVAVLPDSAVVHYGCLNRASSSAHRSDGAKAGSWSRLHT
ncbi:SPX-domain-containing protein [Sodiomyces alkalinus F11]|uniref:SPX-domain-containing protein n=1 Tax=Sodiomyces alkalinus (strain CBS 110278 / VKM F-3762 / F11) TaxID=1314773 RepID=A0A3N2Q0D6_SODAK|nr:SPX-domain-containing protein [Sodiomyces alkalinus F11]ROT40231.1 SPX-domain-containing protein [Sodiomyces alkalinus F11]